MRLSLAPRRWTFIVALWLALATVLTHALALTGSPLLQSSGSAFNPFTSDVALDPKRVGIVEKARNFQSAASDDGVPGEQVRIDTALAPNAQTYSHSWPARGDDRLYSSPCLTACSSTVAFQARAPPLA